MRFRRAFGVLLVIGSSTSVSAVEGGRAIPVERFGVSPAWQAPQKVQADLKGHVFLLRTDTLEVYPVGKGGVLGEPTKLEAATPINAPVLDAAMGPGGPGDWLLRLPLEVRWFVEGKEKSLPPLSWRPWGVGYLRSTPVVSVAPLPAPVNGIVVIRHGEEGPARAPGILELSGDRWSELIDSPWPESRDANTLTETLARQLLAGRDGKLWAAHLYGYILEHYNSAGRLLSTVRVDKGRVEHIQPKDVPIPSEVRQEDRAHFRPFLAVSKLSAIAEGPDRRIYLLVQPGKGENGVYLDRYDPVQGLLERVGLGVQLAGRATLAAGKDALYLAAHAGDQGRWRISWDVLDQAEWKAVQSEEEPQLAGPPAPSESRTKVKPAREGKDRPKASAAGSNGGA